MKCRKSIIFALGLCVSSLFSGIVYGNSGQEFLKDVIYENVQYPLAEQVEYQTQDKEKNYVFSKNIKKDGKEYELVNQSQKIVETILATKMETKEVSIKLEKKDESLIEQQYKDEEGNVYEFKDVTWSEEPRKEYVEYILDLGYCTEQPQYPDSYSYKYDSPITKEKEKEKLPFKELKKTEEAWIDGFTATITFHNLDGVYFNIGNHEFSYNENKLNLTASDYTELVRMLGYDTTKYKLNSASWSGSAYSQNGELCRNAVASGQQYASHYTAVYGKEVTYEPTYTAKVTYEGEIELPEDEEAPTYTVEAYGYYQLKKSILPYISIALIIVLLGIVVVLFRLKKKGKKNDEKK